MDLNTQNNLLARLDRLPIWPYSRGVLFTIGLGFFFAFFDIITIGLAIPVLVQQFHVSLSIVLWCISSSLIGYIVGSLLDSVLSDFFGRRLALILSMLFFSVGSILSAFSPNIYFLIAMRFIIGMGIGSEIANVTTYLGELSPANIRGKMTSVAVALGFLGFAVVPFVGLALIPNYAWGWRVVFALGGLGALVVMFCRRFIPQSIRWLVSHNKLEEARMELEALEARVLLRIKKALPPIQIQEIFTTSSYKDLFKPAQFKTIVFFSVIWFFYYIGNYAWLTLDTKLFLLGGFDLHNSLLLVSVSSLGFILGSLFAIFFSDRFERKYTIFVAAIVWVLCLLAIAWWPSLWLIMVLGCLAAITISILIPLLYTLTGESFPTSCRATGISVTDGVGHLGGAFCGQIIFAVYDYTKASGHGVSFAFTAMTVTGLIAAILVLFGLRMTQQSLRQ